MSLPDTAEYWNDVKGGGRRFTLYSKHPYVPDKFHSLKHPCAWAAEKLADPDWLNRQYYMRAKKAKVTCQQCLANWPQEAK